MKIDSPTFLTETTFISASVQFSSGSQKFGDTTDDLHQFTGSQSTTGTGSFAIVETSNIRPQGGNWDSSLYVPNQLILGSDTDTMIRKYTSNVLEFRMGGQDLIRFDGNNGQVFIENANLVLDSGKSVSGSATSTGSFGTLRLKDRVMIGEFGNSNFIFAREGDQQIGRAHV